MSVIKKLSKDVINRIAAGEVVQKPASALKEMLENSIDAGSTAITITVKGGGIEYLQIQDNGHGIRVEDLPILCERFTTSKLQQYDDLKTIQTFGFRGEALASISYVSHMTVITKTNSTSCAYKAKYTNGILIPYDNTCKTAEPKPCAGMTGTTITVEDVFYNLPSRKQAYKDYNEQYHHILEVVLRYSIHYGDQNISFICKRKGQSATDVHTPNHSSTVNNIQLIYGTSVSQNLITLNCQCPLPPNTSTTTSTSNTTSTMDSSDISVFSNYYTSYNDNSTHTSLDNTMQEKSSNTLKNDYLVHIKGYITNANYSTKKMIFILFINNRLVESMTIKKMIDTIYTDILPRYQHPFIYLSLTMPSHHVDVNVHPTKKEVHFLYEEKILEFIYMEIRKVVVQSNQSRQYIVNCNNNSIGNNNNSTYYMDKNQQLFSNDNITNMTPNKSMNNMNINMKNTTDSNTYNDDNSYTDHSNIHVQMQIEESDKNSLSQPPSNESIINTTSTTDVNHMMMTTSDIAVGSSSNSSSSSSSSMPIHTMRYSEEDGDVSNNTELNRSQTNKIHTNYSAQNDNNTSEITTTTTTTSSSSSINELKKSQEKVNPSSKLVYKFIRTDPKLMKINQFFKPSTATTATNNTTSSSSSHYSNDITKNTSMNNSYSATIDSVNYNSSNNSIHNNSNLKRKTYESSTMNTPNTANDHFKYNIDNDDQKLHGNTDNINAIDDDMTCLCCQPMKNNSNHNNSSSTTTTTSATDINMDILYCQPINTTTTAYHINKKSMKRHKPQENTMSKENNIDTGKHDTNTIRNTDNPLEINISTNNFTNTTMVYKSFKISNTNTCQHPYIQKYIAQLYANNHAGLQHILRNHTWIGMVNDMYCMIQYETKVLLMNYNYLTSQLFEQLIHRQVGEFPCLSLPPTHTIDIQICLTAYISSIHHKGQKDDVNNTKGYTENDVQIIVQSALDTLQTYASFLKHYFQIGITTNYTLYSLPEVLPYYEPSIQQLPVFLFRVSSKLRLISVQYEHYSKYLHILINAIQLNLQSNLHIDDNSHMNNSSYNYSDLEINEQTIFHDYSTQLFRSICQELCHYYSYIRDNTDNYLHENNQDSNTVDTVISQQYHNTIFETYIYPAIKYFLILQHSYILSQPSNPHNNNKSHNNNNNNNNDVFIPITSLEKLYKVFERC